MSDVENTEIPLSQAWRENSLAILALGLCFLVSHMLAMYLVPAYEEAEVQAFEDPDDPVNSVFYIAIILVFTAFVLWIARKGLEWVLQAIFMSAIGVTFIYVFYPFFHSVGITGFAGYIGATALAIELTFLLLTYPEWYVVDIAGVILAAGVAAIFGISFGLFPALLLLVGLAIYDAWAVYRTGHMVDLADSVMNLKLPILLVMPKSKGYSFLDQGSLVDQIEKGEKREALFMGLGDLVIPGALVVSSKASLGWMVGISSMIGGLIGFCILMVFVLSGRPQAGLPLLNGGAILGYVVGAFIFVGNLGL
jgi:presenilin-like A22 family membrane protease